IFFFQAEDVIRYRNVTGVQTCALPILGSNVGSLSPGILAISISFMSLVASFSYGFKVSKLNVPANDKVLEILVKSLAAIPLYVILFPSFYPIKFVTLTYSLTATNISDEPLLTRIPDDLNVLSEALTLVLPQLVPFQYTVVFDSLLYTLFVLNVPTSKTVFPPRL